MSKKTEEKTLTGFTGFTGYKNELNGWFRIGLYQKSKNGLMIQPHWSGREVFIPVAMRD